MVLDLLFLRLLLVLYMYYIFILICCLLLSRPGLHTQYEPCHTNKSDDQYQSHVIIAEPVEENGHGAYPRFLFEEEKKKIT